MEIKLILTYLKVLTHQTSQPLSLLIGSECLSNTPKCAIEVFMKGHFSGVKPLVENT